MATLYRTKSGPITVNPEDGTFHCEELQTYVGGYFECVHLPNNQILICNEEGILLNLPVNMPVFSQFGISIRGNALLIEASELQ
jgi:hypothetical protein